MAHVILLIVCFVALFSLLVLDLSWQISCFSIMGKDRAIFDASSLDHCHIFKFFVANFRDFCAMKDYINWANGSTARTTGLQPNGPKPWQLSIALFPKWNGTFSPPPLTLKYQTRINRILLSGLLCSPNIILVGSQ